MPESEKTSWLLSKTSFIKGRQCVKALYLHKYKRELKSEPSKKQEKIFNKGRSFEAQFRKAHFPQGIDISKELGENFAAYKPFTDSFLDKHQECTLFEAGVISSDVLVLVDVLHKNEDGSIEVYEIKNSTKIKSVFLWDASLQYYVCQKAFGDKLRSFNLVLRSKSSSFKIIDIREQAEKKLSQIKEDIQRFTAILKMDGEPQIEMGKQCSTPYECAFKEYCRGEQQ